MHWYMRSEFEAAYKAAGEILDKISYDDNGMMVKTSSIIDAVEKHLNVDVKFSEYDFRKLSDMNDKLDFEHYGAAMCIEKSAESTVAKILLNSRESPQMQRFSLVHELGHLMTQHDILSRAYRVSAHIDMNITSIPDEYLDDKKNKFLIYEQAANIFALVVLIPYDKLLEAIEKFDSVSEAAVAFGVDKNALISRLLLEDAQKSILNAD